MRINGIHNIKHKQYYSILYYYISLVLELSEDISTCNGIEPSAEVVFLSVYAFHASFLSYLAYQTHCLAYICISMYLMKESVKYHLLFHLNILSQFFTILKYDDKKPKSLDIISDKRNTSMSYELSCRP